MPDNYTPATVTLTRRGYCVCTTSDRKRVNVYYAGHKYKPLLYHPVLLQLNSQGHVTDIKPDLSRIPKGTLDGAVARLTHSFGDIRGVGGMEIFFRNENVTEKVSPLQIGNLVNYEISLNESGIEAVAIAPVPYMKAVVIGGGKKFFRLRPLSVHYDDFEVPANEIGNLRLEVGHPLAIPLNPDGKPRISGINVNFESIPTGIVYGKVTHYTSEKRVGNVFGARMKLFFYQSDIDDKSYTPQKEEPVSFRVIVNRTGIKASRIRKI